MTDKRTPDTDAEARTGKRTKPEPAAPPVWEDSAQASDDIPVPEAPAAPGDPIPPVWEPPLWEADE